MRPHTIAAAALLGAAVLEPAGPALARGLPCPNDWDRSGATGPADQLAFVADAAQNAAAADIDADGAPTAFDLIAFLAAYDSACADADLDRVIDAFETGTRAFVSPVDTGTDPLDADTDGDDLKDGDEVYGTASGLDLPAFGVSPLRRDILVETDWFDGPSRNHRPTAAVVSLIRDAFAAAPLLNPDGSAGVSIHIDHGQGGPFTGGNRLPGAPAFILFDSDFNGYKRDHFDPRRQGLFHYAIFVDRYNSSTNNSSGFAEINGDDFVVSLRGSSSFNIATTFVHEIGHNLGLRHGGDTNTNEKPNYNSVMNYRYQFAGADTDGDARGDRLIDYSSGVNIDLDETDLLEPLGVDGFTPIDWDRDGVIDPAPVARNINCDSASVTSPCGQDLGCGSTFCGTLRDHDDWNDLNWFRLRNEVEFGAPVELTEPPLRRLRTPIPPTETVECTNVPPDEPA